MSKIIIGVGECAVSNNPDDEIKTFALGSCVALIILDPKIRAGAMAHIALVDSSTDLEKAKRLPAYFADTGIPYLLNELSKIGSLSKNKYIIKLVGGASVAASDDYFEIGKKNINAIRKELWDRNLVINAEDVGKKIVRTVTLRMSDGKIIISSMNNLEWSV